MCARPPRQGQALLHSGFARPTHSRGAAVDRCHVHTSRASVCARARFGADPQRLSRAKRRCIRVCIPAHSPSTRSRGRSIPCLCVCVCTRARSVDAGPIDSGRHDALRQRCCCSIRSPPCMHLQSVDRPTRRQRAELRQVHVTHTPVGRARSAGAGPIDSGHHNALTPAEKKKNRAKRRRTTTRKQSTPPAPPR